MLRLSPSSGIQLKKVLLLGALYACCLGLITWLAWKASGMTGIRFIELEPLWHPKEIGSHLYGLEEPRYIHLLLFADYFNIILYIMLFRELIKLFYEDAGYVLLLPVLMGVCDIAENFVMSQLLNEVGMPDARVLNVIILAKLAIALIIMVIIIRGILKGWKRRGAQSSSGELGK